MTEQEIRTITVNIEQDTPLSQDAKADAMVEAFAPLAEIAQLVYFIEIIGWVNNDAELSDIDQLLKTVQENPSCHHRLISLPELAWLSSESAIIVTWIGDEEATDQHLAEALAIAWNRVNQPARPPI